MTMFPAGPSFLHRETAPPDKHEKRCAVLSGFLDELYAIGTLADDHDTEYDGEHYVTPSLIDHDDGKEED